MGSEDNKQHASETGTEQNHWSEGGRATPVGNVDALARPPRSVLSLALKAREQVETDIASSRRWYRRLGFGSRLAVCASVWSPPIVS